MQKLLVTGFPFLMISQLVQSVDVIVAPSNPNVLYVCSGEGLPPSPILGIAKKCLYV